MSHKRKSPIEHGVKSHRRRGKDVENFRRGSGSRSRTVQTTGSSLSILKAKQKEFTIDEHRRKLKKIGDKISYLDNGKRVSGDVVGIRAEYYLVERNGKVWKVDRHSIFTRIGDALKGAGAKLLTAGKEGLAGAAKLTEEGIARRISERRNWNEHKKEIEQEEKLVFEREKIKIRREEERRKFRAKIRAGPNWKKALKVGRILVEQESKKTQRKAFDSLVGKKQSKDIINAIARAKREAEGKKIKSKRRVKKQKTRGKTITIIIKEPKTKVKKKDKQLAKDVARLRRGISEVKSKKKREEIEIFLDEKDKDILEFSKAEKQQLTRIVFPEDRKLGPQMRELTEEEREKLK